MTLPFFARAAAAFVLLFLSTASGFAQSLAPGTERVFDVAGGQRIKVTGIAGGLAHPWSLAFPDTRTMLVTERPGRLRVIRDGVLLPQPAWQSPPPPGKDTDGLHFIALHPQFAQNRLVYISHPKYGETRQHAGDFARRVRRHHAAATSAKSSSPTPGRPAATWPAASSSRPTARSTSPSAIATALCCDRHRGQQPADEGAGRSTTTSARRCGCATTARCRPTTRSSAAPAPSRRSTPTATATATG